jgi:hypothetical protein
MVWSNCIPPGGHGALLANLGAFASDIVLVKNIDNIARDDLRKGRQRASTDLVYSYPSKEVHDAVRGLRKGEDPRLAIELLETRFGILPVQTLHTRGVASLRDSSTKSPNTSVRCRRNFGARGGRIWVDTEAVGQRCRSSKAPKSTWPIHAKDAYSDNPGTSIR